MGGRSGKTRPKTAVKRTTAKDDFAAVARKVVEQAIGEQLGGKSSMKQKTSR